MTPGTQVARVASCGKALWTGRVLSGLAIAFLAADGVGKLVKPPAVVEGTIQLGYPLSSIVGIGIVLLACVIVHAVPRTAMVGAILLTGYLGGAVATQVRVGNPLFSHVLFPVYLGVLIWAGLVLRNPRVRAAIFGPSIACQAVRQKAA